MWSAAEGDSACGRSSRTMVSTSLTEIALGSVYRQAADVGEVLTTVDRIHDGKARSWVDEWTATADRLAHEAAANAAAGRTYSAAGQYLRASLYYSVATYDAPV